MNELPIHQPTLAYTAPFVIFLVLVQFYPSFSGLQQLGSDSIHPSTRTYMVMLGVQIAIAATLLFYFRKFYLRDFPWKVSVWGFVVGAIGVVVWVAICQMEIEGALMALVGFDSARVARPAFNPFEHLPSDTWRILFLVPRFLVLALVVPLVEELFLRGWLVRFVHDADWEPVKLSMLSWAALIAPTVYGVATHPGEAIAAIAWFSLVTVLMVKTKNIWDCVVAHAVTNFLLGVYVVCYAQWQLW